MSAADAYRVAATLAVKITGIGSVTSLAERMERIDKATTAAKENLEGISASLRSLDGVARAVGAIGKAMDKLGSSKLGTEKLAAQADQVARMGSSLEGMARQQENMVRSARAVSEAWRATDAAVQQASRARFPQAASGGNGRRSSNKEDHLSTMDVAMAADTTGGVVDRLVEAMAHSSFEAAYYQNMLQADARISPKQASAAYDAAFAATRTAPGSTVNKNMEALYDVTNVTGSVDDATKIVPQFAMLSSVLRASNLHETGNDDQALAAAKALEVLGRLTDEKRNADGTVTRSISADRLTKYTDAIARVAVRTGGRVDPAMYLSFAKQARVAGMESDDKFLFEQIPALMQVLGGQRTGTFLNSANSVFAGNHMLDKTMEAFIRAGLADKSGLGAEKGPDGKQHTVVRPEAIHDLDLLKTNQIEYIRKITDVMRGQGKSNDQILSTLQILGQRTTIGGGWADIFANLPGIDREATALRNTLKPGANGKDPLKTFLTSNPEANVQAFNASFQNLLAAFSKDALPQGIKLMNDLTAAMTKMGDWAAKNPGEAKLITDTAVALGVLATAVGVISTAMLIYGPIFRAIAAGKIVGKAASAVADGIGTATRSAAGGIGAVAKGAIGAAARIGTRFSPFGIAGSAILESTPTADDDDAAGMRKRAAALGIQMPTSNVPPPPVAPSGSSGPVPVHVVNGTDLARGVTAVQARSMSGPSDGTTGFDGRTTPLATGAGGLF